MYGVTKLFLRTKHITHKALYKISHFLILLVYLRGFFFF